MSIIAMRVSNVGAHPNADTLFVVELTAPDIERLIVIANSERQYTAGDQVVVARVGAVLEDGTKISKVRLRGLDSFGMIVGPTDAEPGTNLSAEYGQPNEPESGPESGPEPEPAETGLPAGVSVVRWTSLEGLPHVRKAVRAQMRFDQERIVFPTITYRAKVKIDGTNAAVHILPEGQSVAQSRTRLLTPDSDNHGFATWVHEHQAYFGALHEQMGRAVVYGEWCGPGIQKNVAINKIGRKMFLVFAIQLGDPGRDSLRMVVHPEQIARRLPDHPDIRVLPWQGEPVTLNFHDDGGLDEGAEEINQMVEKIEAVDPWVAEHFEIEGRGEGVVLYPVEGIDFDDEGTTDRSQYTDLMFKAKGESFRVNRQPKAVQVDPQVAAGIGAFVEQFVTIPRLEQGLTEGCQGELAMKRMGDFLRWVGRDVKKESALELEASGLEWKQVAKAVAAAAQQWYRRRIADAG